MGDLTPEELAALRKGIRQSLAQGYPAQAIDAKLKEKYGVTSAQIMQPNGRDFGRAVAQGVTLGHADELAGLGAKLTGGDYTAARDRVRENDAQFSAAHPVLNGATQMTAGALPALLASLIPGLQPVAGATLANAGRGMALGGMLGAAGGEGRSTASTAGGVARDAALGGTVGGVLGGAGGAVASKIAGGGMPKGNAGVVASEASTQLPRDPVALQASLARQETLAPGSVVLADVSPEMRAMVRGVGADPKTAVAAREAAQQRLQTLNAAKRSVGASYDVLKGRMEPVDPDLTMALAQAGRRNILPKGAKDVDLSKLHDLRSQLLSEARATRNAYVAKQKNDAADALTAWLAKKEPAVQQLDADYAFLTDRLKAAKQTLKEVANSSKNYAVSRTYDVEPASVGASLPTIRSAPGVAIKAVSKVFGPDRAGRARAVNSLLLNPAKTQDGLTRLVSLHDLLMHPPETSGLAGASAVLSGLGGQAGAALVQP